MKDPVEQTYKAVYHAALRLLARREHGTRELREKLRHKGHPHPLIDKVLSSLKTDNLLSDQRFAEAYSRSRMQKGYGPVRIAAELRQKGIESELIQQTLYNSDIDWREVLQRTYLKRFGDEGAPSLKEQARRSRFLSSRGFSGDAICDLLTDDDIT